MMAKKTMTRLVFMIISKHQTIKGSDAWFLLDMEVVGQPYETNSTYNISFVGGVIFNMEQWEVQERNTHTQSTHKWNKGKDLFCNICDSTNGSRSGATNLNVG